MIGEDNADIAEQLAGFIAVANVTERKNTGHGFYTTFEVDRRQAPLRLERGPVSGPNLDVRVRHQVLMMGFLLWLTDGYPSCLEGFQYATRAGDNIDLRDGELAALVSLGRLPPTTLVQ